MPGKANWFTVVSDTGRLLGSGYQDTDAYHPVWVAKRKVGLGSGELRTFFTMREAREWCGTAEQDAPPAAKTHADLVDDAARTLRVFPNAAGAWGIVADYHRARHDNLIDACNEVLGIARHFGELGFYREVFSVLVGRHVENIQAANSAADSADDASDAEVRAVA